MARHQGIRGAQTDTLCLGRVNDASYPLWKHLIRPVSHYYNHLQVPEELAIAR
jgi:hypothetical protein